MCVKQNTERLIKGVFTNNLEEIKRIIDDGDFDPSSLRTYLRD